MKPHRKRHRSGSYNGPSGIRLLKKEPSARTALTNDEKKARRLALIKILAEQAQIVAKPPAIAASLPADDKNASANGMNGKPLNGHRNGDGNTSEASKNTNDLSVPSIQNRQARLLVSAWPIGPNDGVNYGSRLIRTTSSRLVYA